MRDSPIIPIGCFHCDLKGDTALSVINICSCHILPRPNSKSITSASWIVGNYPDPATAMPIHFPYLHRSPYLISYSFIQSTHNTTTCLFFSYPTLSYPKYDVDKLTICLNVNNRFREETKSQFFLRIYAVSSLQTGSNKFDFCYAMSGGLRKSQCCYLEWVIPF